MLTLPENIRFVINSLERAGFEADAVGGCVRDALMGIEPHDWDVCTSALPEDVSRVFSSCHLIETGLKHGTVTVLSEGEPVEVTTFRADGPYSDNRRPDSVRFVRSLAEDLSRRDFTVNAMAFSPARGLVDLFGGREDIARKLIRCVGEPAERFREDGLRILRALRFAARLGFIIEERTADAVHECRELLHNIAAERIYAELRGILSGRYAGEVLEAFGDVASVILPGRAEDWETACAALAAAPEDLFIRLCLLLQWDRASCARTLAALRCDNETKAEVTWLCAHGTARLPESACAMRVCLAEHGAERVRRLIEFRAALAAARGEEPEEIEAASDLCARILARNPVLSVKQLAVTGLDLLEAGIPQGKELGDLIAALLRRVVSCELPNQRSVLLREAQKLYAGEPDEPMEETCEDMESESWL